MQYFVMKDEETGEIELIGRFRKFGIGESFLDDKWSSDSQLIRLLHDGLLEEISETEAKDLIEKLKQPQLQAA